MNDLYAGIVGVIVLAVAVFVLHVPVLLAIVVGIVVYVAVRFLLPKRDEVKAANQAEAKRAVRAGKAALGQIREQANQMDKASVRGQVLRICELADNILADFQSKPSDIGYAPNFVENYLTPLQNVLDRYVRLSSKDLASDGEATLSKIETDLLPRVEGNFSTLYNKLSEDDVMDLDATTEGLKSLLETESIGS